MSKNNTFLSEVQILNKNERFNLIMNLISKESDIIDCVSPEMKYLITNDISHLFQLPSPKIYRLIKKYNILYVKDGGRIFILKTSLIKMVRSQLKQLTQEYCNDILQDLHVTPNGIRYGR